MTFEEAKKELGEYIALIKRCELKKKKIEELRRLAQSCKGINYGEQMGGGNNSISFQIAKIADFERELNVERLKAEEVCNNIHNKIYLVGEHSVLFANILEMRYVLCYKLEKIAVETNYDYSWVKRLIKKAIQIYSIINSKN